MFKFFTGLTGIISMASSLAISACSKPNEKTEPTPDDDIPDDTNEGNESEKHENYLLALMSGNSAGLEIEDLVEGHKWVMSKTGGIKAQKLQEVFPNGIERVEYSENKDESHFNSVFDYTGQHTPLFKIGGTATGAYLIEQEQNEVIMSGVNFTTNGNIGEIKDSKIYFDMLRYLTRNVSKGSNIKIGVLGSSNEVDDYLNKNNANSFPSDVSGLNLSGKTEDQKRDEINGFDLIIVNNWNDNVNDVIDSGKPVMMHFQSVWWHSKPWEYVLNKFNMFYTCNGGTARPDAMVGVHPISIKEPINPTITYQAVAKIGSNEIDSMLNALYAGSINVTAEPGAFKDTVRDSNPEHDWTKIKLDSDGRSVQNAVYAGIKQVENLMKGFDRMGNDIFDTSLNYYKGILLQADYYRRHIKYKGKDFDLDFWDWDDSAKKLSIRKNLTPAFKALFADSAILYSRKTNSAQTNLGDFSPNESEIRKMQTRSVTTTIKAGRDPHSVGTSTGIYVKAGQVVSIKLKTQSADKLSVRISTLRDGSLRAEWPTRYGRPYSIQSNSIPLKYNETVHLSSPHGGPLYLLTDSSNHTDYEIEFRNVLRHPALLNPEDPLQISEFKMAVQNTPFNWIDLKTDFAELHMTKETYDKSINLEFYGGDVIKYFNHYAKYTISNNFEYAGFSGDGLAEFSDDVKKWGNSINLYDEMFNQDIHGKRWTQHYNIERPTCGDLCSGNPADQWAPHFIATSWGENHEIGHNLQNGRMSVYGGLSGEVSNNIFPGRADYKLQLDDTSLNYFSTDGNRTQMYFDRTDHSQVFTLLNQSFIDGTASNSDHPLWNGDYFDRLSVYHQMKYASQSEDFFTMAYLYARFIDYYTGSDERWTDEIKTKLKLTRYTRTEAREKVVGGDLFAILASMVSDYDVSDFFDGLGIEVSAEARNQITENGQTTKLQKGLFYVYQEVTSDYKHFVLTNHGEFRWNTRLSQMELPSINDIVPFASGATYQKP